MRIPRDYQLEFLDKIQQNYSRGIYSSLGVCATGAGKTFISYLIHKWFKENHGKKTLFLVDQIDLAHQTKESFLDNDATLKIDIEMGEFRSHKNADIVIASVPSLGKLGSERITKFKQEEFGAIFADEAHKSMSPSWLNVLRYFGVHPEDYREGKLLVGLTATPNREDGVGLSYLYDDLIGPYDISYCIRNGWLTEIDWYPVSTGLDISQANFSEEGLIAATEDDRRKLLVVKAYRELANNESAIVYCSSVTRAEEIAALFNANNIPAYCIHANTIPEVRKQKLQDYKDGKIKVLTNYNTLSTGVDAPDTSCIIFERVIGSQLLYTQCVGRGLRPSPSAFVDSFSTAAERINAIKYSIKPSVKVIDLCDNVGTHSVCSVPMLFGLSPSFRKENTESFFKEVVEVIDDLVDAKPVDRNKLLSLEDIDLIVSTERLEIRQFNLAEEVTAVSNFEWYKINNETYRAEFPYDKKSIIIKKNLLDNYEVMLYDNQEKMTKKLNEFSSVVGAVNIAEKFANENFTTRIAEKDAQWRNEPITGAQYYLIWRFNKWNKKFRFDKENLNELGVPRIFKNGQELFRGDASKELGKRFNK